MVRPSMNAPAGFPLDEYHALRSGFGCVDLADWTSITLSGRDRQTFLNNFCTNDVKRLQPGERCEVFITNVKGKILAHGLVDCRADELVLITVPGQAERLIAHLDRYIIREDVQLRNSTAERKYFLIAGGDAAGGGLTHDRWIHWRILEVPICGLIEAPVDQFLTILGELRADGARPCGAAALQSLRVESGMPLYGSDFDEENLPQEIGRDEEAISFTKGCYLGQETVARIDALGHVNQQLVGVRWAGPDIPVAGQELMSNGTPAGRITTITYSPQLEAPLALAILRRNWAAPGTKLSSPAGPCEVIDLPLFS
ncbi:MAG: folate-binding protein YgfZ [Pirellulales bacterium]